MTTAVQNSEVEVSERNWDVALIPHQYEFMKSEARFPSIVAGWGTGKSMCLILKCLKAAQDYPNNLVLIVRYSFTDLRDSTMRDFERYTGIVIPSNKDVVLSNGSRIMFRHGSELATLQNINLGAFGIEQAEEFDSAGEFTMLRGRLRRAGADAMPDEANDEEDHDDVKRFGAVIANAQGHNWIWDLWERHNPERKPKFQQWYATTFDNAKNLPADFIEDLKDMELDSPTKYRQYVMNSRDELDVEGSYYAKLIGQARVDKRIGSVPYDPNAPVYTFWDVGFTDATAIGFVQFIRNEIHFIDYYENNQEEIAHYLKVLQNKPYIYAEKFLWAPPDIQGKQFNIGKSSWDVARGLGFTFDIVERHEKQHGIDDVRRVLHRCWFDEDKCVRLLEALEHFQRQKNKALSTDERAVFSKTPVEDWAIHAADMMRYFARAYNNQLRVNDVAIGATEPTTGKVLYLRNSQSQYKGLRHRCGRRSA